MLDVDAHHGDGTQALFWDDDVLTVSIHEYGGRFFPGTGAASERGTGRGLGYAVNFPLARESGDEEFLRALDLALGAIRAYAPELLLVQFGTDGHADDPYAHLCLGDAAYVEVAERAHALAHEVCDGRLVLLGGGGYAPRTVARVWTAALGAVGGFRILAGDA